MKQYFEESGGINMAWGHCAMHNFKESGDRNLARGHRATWHDRAPSVLTFFKKNGARAIKRGVLDLLGYLRY